MSQCDLCETALPEGTPRQIEVRPSGNYGDLTIVCKLCAGCFKDLKTVARITMLAAVNRSGITVRGISNRWNESHANGVKVPVPSR